MGRQFVLIIILVAFSLQGFCQEQPRYFRITSSHTSFPDTGRASGHLYDSVMYSTAEHYLDSSVLMVVPAGLKAGSKVNLVFWFHGWQNNIDTALVKYGLARQFEASKVNAVLVLAETARNAPDSYGGKLEQLGTFALLVKDVLHKLVEERVIPGKCSAGHVLLAGHSGAYRVMAGILQNGNIPIDEVILFDALYANTNTFINWIATDKDHRFIDLYTDNGGTLEETQRMRQQLIDMKIRADSTEESQVTDGMLKASRVLFIHTPHQHDFIIQHPDNFLLFLKNTQFLKRLK